MLAEQIFEGSDIWRHFPSRPSPSILPAMTMQARVAPSFSMNISSRP
jgi:hypothetical protein